MSVDMVEYASKVVGIASVPPGLEDAPGKYMSGEHKQVLSALQTYAQGRENARTQHWLAARSEMNHDVVRAIIRDLRLAGWPIYASSSGNDGGYFLPGKDDEAECKHAVAEMYSRIRRLYEVAKPLYADYKRRYNSSVPEAEMMTAEQMSLL